MDCKRFKTRMLNAIDKLANRGERLAYLNDQFIKATASRELIILEMIKDIKNY